jgi:hypothetical protein
VHFLELAIQIATYDDLGCSILPDDALYQSDDGVSSFHDEAVMAWLQVDVENVEDEKYNTLIDTSTFLGLGPEESPYLKQPSIYLGQPRGMKTLGPDVQ